MHTKVLIDLIGLAIQREHDLSSDEQLGSYPIHCRIQYNVLYIVFFLGTCKLIQVI